MEEPEVWGPGKLKIIGWGNRDRGDDGAGIVVAERLRELGLGAETHEGDALALIDKWGAIDDVILVDAVASGGLPGTVMVWEAADGEENLPKYAGAAGVSSHGFDIAHAIELARALGRLPARLRVYGIEGATFEHGAAVSPSVLAATDAVVQKISERYA